MSMTEELGAELPTSVSASLFKVRHCGMWSSCDLCVARPHTEFPPQALVLVVLCVSGLCVLCVLSVLSVFVCVVCVSTQPSAQTFVSAQLPIQTSSQHCHDTSYARWSRP